MSMFCRSGNYNSGREQLPIHVNNMTAVLNIHLLSQTLPSLFLIQFTQPSFFISSLVHSSNLAARTISFAIPLCHPASAIL